MSERLMPAWRDETTIIPDELGTVRGHGTARAAIVHALAPRCRLHRVRVLGERNSGSGDLILRGLRGGHPR